MTDALFALLILTFLFKVNHLNSLTIDLYTDCKYIYLWFNKRLFLLVVLAKFSISHDPH